MPLIAEHCLDWERKKNIGAHNWRFPFTLKRSQEIWEETSGVWLFVTRAAWRQQMWAPSSRKLQSWKEQAQHRCCQSSGQTPGPRAHPGVGTQGSTVLLQGLKICFWAAEPNCGTRMAVLSRPRGRPLCLAAVAQKHILVSQALRPGVPCMGEVKSLACSCLHLCGFMVHVQVYQGLFPTSLPNRQESLPEPPQLWSEGGRSRLPGLCGRFKGQGCGPAGSLNCSSSQAP